LATLGGIAIIVSVLMLVIKLNEVREIKQVQEIQNILVKQQQKYYDNLLKQDQETRKFRHDINEHFQCISMLTKLEKIPELQEYVSGLIGKFDIIKSDLKTDTGAEIVNVILYDLELQYESLGIEIRWEGAIPSHTKIAINDTSTLFSNLLKNSFEAAVKCEENKFIKVQTRSDRTNFYVMVENSYSGDELITNNKQKTSKRDKLNHGYGLTIIREIVEKYNGIMIVSGENNVHKVEIILKDVLDLKIN
jgi:sensor histidine kinase regulating citrate/malate metabolism